jgi:hypothetical protein
MKDKIELKNHDLESMADAVHQVWCKWMEYMFKQGHHMSVNGQSLWVMNDSAKRRWFRQMITPYVWLPENEKTSDRDIAALYLSIAYLSNITEEQNDD